MKAKTLNLKSETSLFVVSVISYYPNPLSPLL